VEANYRANKASVAELVNQVQKQWDAGQLYEAGQNYGKFWTTLIGKPVFDENFLTEDLDSEEELSIEHPLAVFYGSGLENLWKESRTKQISECLINDDLALIAWDFAIGSLNPYNEANWTKYFNTIGTLDMFDWAPCMQNADLKKLTDKNAKWWADFWAQPNAKRTMEQNIEKNKEAVGLAVLSLQSSWRSGDYANAGKAYADFWGLLMGRPQLAAQTKTANTK